MLQITGRYNYTLGAQLHATKGQSPFQSKSQVCQRTRFEIYVSHTVSLSCHSNPISRLFRNLVLHVRASCISAYLEAYQCILMPIDGRNLPCSGATRKPVQCSGGGVWGRVTFDWDRPQKPSLHLHSTFPAPFLIFDAPLSTFLGYRFTEYWPWLLPLSGS